MLYTHVHTCGLIKSTCSYTLENTYMCAPNMYIHMGQKKRLMGERKRRKKGRRRKKRKKMG